jgi:pimeloyl-ACP methyl ester carboxylesterase
MIDSLSGPTVVVAHSYGGRVITEAAKGAANVIALVFLASFAPDEGESTQDLLGKYPATDLLQAIRPDAAGFAYVDRAQFHTIFCADLDPDLSLVLAATQKPVHGSTFGVPSGPAAWHDVPTFYAVSSDDKCINPELERFLAARMQATTISLPSSHVAMLSHPKQVAELIVQAAQAK